MPPVKKVKSKNVSKAAPVAVAAEPAVPSAVEPVVSGQLEKKIKKKAQKQQNKAERGGVVFIKHLPHGFFEEQLKGYFSQFGEVTRLRLARSLRTGGSKGFAFVEFKYPEVAQVAAETMDNYLMFKKVVKASYIPPDKQRFNYFKSSLRKVKNKAGKEIYISSKTAAKQRMLKSHNDWSDDAYQKRTLANLAKVNKLNEKYAHLGIDFSKIVVAPKKLTDAESSQEAADKEKTDEAAALAVAGGSSVETKTGKRKSVAKVAAAAGAKKQNLKKAKNTEAELKDLLGATINEDSDDEDYIAITESEGDDDEDDDDVMSVNSAGDDDEEVSDLDDDASSVEEAPPKPVTKKTKPTFAKSAKPSKVDRFEQLIKRKPHLGGIQKLNKKAPVKAAASKVKNSLQLAAVKEIAKPLPKLGNKALPKSKGKKFKR